MKYEKTLNLIFSNDLIMEELRSLFMEQVEKNRPQVHGQDDLCLGQEYRAYTTAQEIVDDAFIALKSLQRNESGTGKISFK